MPEGQITKFFQDRNFGVIRPDTGGPDVFFLGTDAPDVPPGSLVAGTRVQFEIEHGPRGPRVRQIRAIGTAAPSGHEQGAGRSVPSGESAHGTYRFLNPYNFVRPLSPKHADRHQLLGRCAPPPHDRSVGLTGRLTCSLVATSPLFISDSEAVPDSERVNEDERRRHYHYRFFSYDGERPAIPGSSLRGAVRSVFEALTSSCFSVFDASRRLSYHLPAEEAHLVPGRVIKDDEGWKVELLPGTTPAAIKQRPRGPQYAAWISRYDPIQRSRSAGSAPGSSYSQRARQGLAGIQRFKQCQALIVEIAHPTKNFSFWNVVAIAPMSDPPLQPRSRQERRVEGYLCVTNQNIENKHDERLFFRDGIRRVVLPLDASVVRYYNDLIKDYQDRHEDEVERRRREGIPSSDRDRSRSGLSWFIYERTTQRDKLEPGDLAYVMLGGPPSAPTVEFIAPVSVPRVAYEKRIGELLGPVGNDTMSTVCDVAKHLCPACRVFGWVKTARADEAEGVAYAGRVRFAHGTPQGELRTLDGEGGLTLAILSTPKPTTTRFYLAPSGGKPRDRLDDHEVGYDAPAQQLRGRKVYRHHGECIEPNEYRRADDRRNEQNRTIHGVLQPESTFGFTVHFENLARVELGALLWALELNGWHHRLGLGKPLGFGSVRICVDSLEVVDEATRYTALSSGIRDASAMKKALLDGFEAAMADRYGATFKNLPNVRDLEALLARTPSLPVHYPRSTEEPDPEGKNYEWFIGNKRKGGPRLALRLAVDDTEGFPLLDRFGR